MAIKTNILRGRLTAVNNILNSISDCFISLDRQWRFTYINKAAAKFFHFKRRTLLGKCIWDIVPEKDGIQKSLELAMIRRNAVCFETYAGFLNCWVEIHAYPSFVGLSLFLWDITERKQQEEELRRREQEFQALVEHSRDIIARLDRNLRHLYVNSQLQYYTGLPEQEILGKTLEEITGSRPICRQLADWVKAVIASGKPSLHEATVFDKNGEARDLQYSVIPECNSRGKVDTVLIIARDVTELRRIEFHAAQQERLELLGRMAVNISDEIRNPLTTVKGYLQYFAGKPAFRTYLPQLALSLDEIDRVDKIIKTYLALAANKRSTLRRQNLKALIAGMRPLLEADIGGHNCQLVIQMEELPPIMMNAQEIQELLLHLVRNSLEAMEKGCLTIAAWAAAGKVILEIRDEGRGIPAVIIHRLGTPFVTTKKQGLGLGLPVCFSIVKRHNAEIDFSSGAAGTVVRITFPALSMPED